MNEKKRSTWKERLQSVYWVVVGLVGLGRPIVDRRSMYGDDRRNDPYDIEFDPQPSRGR